jgi:hypothetical protein
VIIFTVRSFKKEADIVKAANLSDVHFIDPAKDAGLTGPKLLLIISWLCFWEY